MKLTSIFFLVLISLPFVSAYNGWGYGYSPFNLLENDWVVFSLIFLIFFAITFFALGKTMHENIGAAVAISAAVSLFISVAVFQRTRFYGFVGEQIGSYLVILALALIIILLIKVITGIVGGVGLFVALFISWFFLQQIDPYSILPDEIIYSDYFYIYEFIIGTGFLILLIILAIIVFVAAYARNEDINKRIRDWLWGKKRPEYYWPWKR